MNATEILKIRVTPTRKALWLAAAKRHDMPSLSAFLRMAADRAMNAQPVYHPAELQQLDQVREQLRAAGVNLNVLLRLLHSGEDMTSYRWRGPEPDEVMRDLKEALTKIRAMIDPETPA